MQEWKERRGKQGSQEDVDSSESLGPSDSEYYCPSGCTWLHIYRSCWEGSTNRLG